MDLFGYEGERAKERGAKTKQSSSRSHFGLYLSLSRLCLQSIFSPYLSLFWGGDFQHSHWNLLGIIMSRFIFASKREIRPVLYNILLFIHYYKRKETKIFILIFILVFSSFSFFFSFFTSSINDTREGTSGLGFYFFNIYCVFQNYPSLHLVTIRRRAVMKINPTRVPGS